MTPDREANDSKKDANSSEQSVLATQTRVELPSGLEPSDIAQVRITLGGNAVLVGNAQP
jgi:hypothetical protein